MSRLVKLRNAKSLIDLADLLGYRSKSVSYIVYRIPDKEKYKQFTIPKRNGGSREIKAPIDRLKLLQARLAQLLTECFEETVKENKKSLSHGFRKGHSIVTNALNHKNKRYVFNIDLLDFFPSINFGRVRGFFIKDKHFQLDPNVATIVAQIACSNNELPQGSPCSPIISNLIGHLLDFKMVAMAKKAKCTYTRYADDLTFSTNKKDFPVQIAVNNGDNKWEASIELKNEIEKVGFSLNEGKTSMQYKTSRQITTGLIVNRKVNIKREYYKKARSYCHELFKYNAFYLDTKFPELPKDIEMIIDHPIAINSIKGTINQLEGILSFIYQIKRPYDEDSNGARKANPNAITKLFRQFLFYKHFFFLDRPLIICEGKTDIEYLKCALRNLHDQYSDFIVSKDGHFCYKIGFLNFSRNLKDVFAISEGTPGLKFLLEIYGVYMNLYKGKGKQFPVIMILDTDSGTDEIMKFLKSNSFKSPFIKYVENLYIVFISDKKGKEIEDLFEKKLLKEKVNGKTFNPNKVHGNETEYGKHIFAERVIKPNQKVINFDGFKPIFNNIRIVLEDYKS